jgi:hypothetical protein
MRVFTVGIGDAASTEMCDGIARAGRGFATYIFTAEASFLGKCVRLVLAARTPPITNFKIFWEKEKPNTSLTQGRVGNAQPHQRMRIGTSTNDGYEYVPPSDVGPRKLLLHFHFIAQVFISSLSGYVFDTAIGGNFEPFLARLSTDTATTSTSETYNDATNEGGFSDVFELAQRHSALLDDILGACLLRSGQRGVGDLLRHLELVLEFSIVVGELHRARIQEYQAAPLIQELFKKFCLKMTTLVCYPRAFSWFGVLVLKTLIDESFEGSWGQKPVVVAISVGNVRGRKTPPHWRVGCRVPPSDSLGSDRMVDKAIEAGLKYVFVCFITSTESIYLQKYRRYKKHGSLAIMQAHSNLREKEGIIKGKGDGLPSLYLRYFKSHRKCMTIWLCSSQGVAVIGACDCGCRDRD